MSRIERLKEIQRMSGPAGASTEKSISYWSARASENSGAPRAKGKMSTNGRTERDLDLPRVPATGEVKLRDAAAKPSRKGDPRETAKSDLNHVGGSYMPRVRRGES
jgi:hypothetical protein